VTGLARADGTLESGAILMLTRSNAVGKIKVSLIGGWKPSLFLTNFSEKVALYARMG
jgi:hypothetical protein